MEHTMEHTAFKITGKCSGCGQHEYLKNQEEIEALHPEETIWDILR